MKFGPKYKWFKISYLNSFFDNIISNITFLYWSTSFSGHHQRFFLISNLLVESLKASNNLRKLSLNLQYSFAQKPSFILQTSAYLTLKIICSRNTAKNFSDFTNFPANIFVRPVQVPRWALSLAPGIKNKFKDFPPGI